MAPGLSPFSAAGEQPHLARPVPGVLRVPHLAAPAAQLLHQEQGDLLQDGLLQVGSGPGPLRGAQPSPPAAGSGSLRRCRGESLENPPGSLEQPGGRRPSGNGEKGRKEGSLGCNCTTAQRDSCLWPGCAGRPEPLLLPARGCAVPGMAPRPGNGARTASSRLLPGWKQALPAGGAQRLSGSPCPRCGPAMAGAPSGRETKEGQRLRPAGARRRFCPEPHSRGSLSRREDVPASTVFLF